MAVLVLSLTACSGGRDYAVPKEMCGVSLDAKKLDPFLFDGKTIEVLGGSLVDTGTNSWGKCGMRVDGKFVLSLEVEKVDKLYDPMAELESFRFVHREKVKDLPFPGLGALGDSNSMVSTGCSSAAADFLIAYVDVDGAAQDDVAGRRKDLQALTVDLVPRVKKALGCTA
ncbi:hypothetical protein ACWCPT_14620 [Streptomyces sp. NPDC002308]